MALTPEERTERIQKLARADAVTFQSLISAAQYYYNHGEEPSATQNACLERNGIDLNVYDFGDAATAWKIQHHPQEEDAQEYLRLRREMSEVATPVRPISESGLETSAEVVPEPTRQQTNLPNYESIREQIRRGYDPSLGFSIYKDIDETLEAIDSVPLSLRRDWKPKLRLELQNMKPNTIILGDNPRAD